MKKILALFIVLFSLTSCIESVVGGTLVGAYVISGDKDTYEHINIDKEKQNFLKTKLKASKRYNFLKDISIDVIDDRIFLTGVTIEELYKEEAYNVVAENSNVSEIINEIQVRDKAYNDGFNDFMIKRQLRMVLSVSPGIKSSNIIARVVNGTVYLFGIAQNKNELKKVADVASKINGVKQVVSHVKLSDI